MNLNIRVSGPAWLWINSTAEIIWNIFADLWYNVLTDIEYESRIKWWTNYFDVFVSDENPIITKYSDIFLWFDKDAVLKNIDLMLDSSIIFINDKFISSFSEELNSKISSKNIQVKTITSTDKYDNTYLISLLAYFLQIPDEIVVDNLRKVFAKKSEETFLENKNVFEKVISEQNFEKSSHKIAKIWEPKPFSYWNKLLAIWAIDTWLEYYSAYPMTPASSILTEIIKSKKVTYLQAEDEIAVINTALWASFTGSRAMVWTSWWGFALMSEALSFAVEAEFPITAVLSMRAWPSTWTPTYFEQWDLNYALNPTFWDFNHIVLYPSSLEEAYFYGWLSLNLADKYQSVVILLMDKQLSEIHWTYRKVDAPKIERWVILENPSDDYKRYELNESWISPRVVVWTKNWDFISTSYEHDEFGATTEDSEMKKLMTEKRFKKLENFFKKEGIRSYELIDEKAKKLIVTMWPNSYVAKEFVRKNPEFGLLIIKILKPIEEDLLEIFKDKEELIFVESNYSGQLENYLVKELGLKFIPNLKIKNLRKYDLYPFYIEDFNELK